MTEINAPQSGPPSGSAHGFVLDPQLDNDTHEVGRLGLCRVLLMNDARFPWLILVPERTRIAEVIELSTADRAQLWNEVERVSEALRAIYAPDKLNIGALGNMVRQLHVHVVARFASDAAWPRPVWGSGQPVPYQAHQAGILVGRLAKALAIEEG